MNLTVLYALPLVPGGVLLGAMIFLLFVPVLALAALIVVFLVTLAIPGRRDR